MYLKLLIRENCFLETFRKSNPRKLCTSKIWTYTVFRWCSGPTVHVQPFSNCSAPRWFWELPPGDLWLRQRWPSFAPPRTLPGKRLLVFLHLTLQETIARRTPMRIRLKDWSLDERQSVRLKLDKCSMWGSPSSDPRRSFETWRLFLIKQWNSRNLNAAWCLFRSGSYL